MREDNEMTASEFGKIHRRRYSKIWKFLFGHTKTEWERDGEYLREYVVCLRGFFARPGNPHDVDHRWTQNTCGSVLIDQPVIEACRSRLLCQYKLGAGICYVIEHHVPLIKSDSWSGRIVPLSCYLNTCAYKVESLPSVVANVRH